MSEWAEFEKPGAQLEIDALGKTAKQKVVQLRALDAKLEKKKDRLDAEDLFASHCLLYRLPKFAREYEFAKIMNRKWRFDYAFVLPRPDPQLPRFKLGVEIEGLVMRKVAGSWQMGGAHGSIKGFKEDCVKYATATLLGWHVVRFEQSLVKSKFAVQMVLRILVRNGWKQKT